MKQRWKKIGLGCFILALVVLAGGAIWLAVMKNRTTETNETDEKETTKKNKLDVEWYDENGKEFTITTADQLFEFAKLSVYYNFEGQTIKLGADIVVNEGNAADWGDQIPERMWDGVGKFAGTFDGQGHTISGICCYGQLYSGVNRTQVDYYTAGLFRFTQKDCVIKNFKLVNSYFKGDMQYGAAAISSNGDGTFESIYTDAIIVNCRNYTGGILGRTSTNKEKTVIRNCWFDGEIRMEGGFGIHIGGIVGRVMEGSTCTIEHCLNTGTISSDAYKKGIQMGGIVGNCQSSTKIIDCLAAGELKNDWKSCVGSVVGGIVKAADVTMTDVYSIGECWEKSVGVSQGKLTGYPVTYTQEILKGVGGYQWTTLDFEKYWTAVPDGIPVLKTFAKDALSCEGIAEKVDTSWYNEEEKTYVLKDEADFYGFSILSRRTTFEGKTVKLAADLTLNSGRASDWAKQEPENKWMPIGSTTSEFEGTFDGQKHTISGVYLKTDQAYNGLFGVVGAKGKVKNFSLKNSYFETSAASFGSIVGRLRGTIDTVYSDAIVVSNDGVNVGGFVGQVPGVGNVSLNNCWFAGTVTNKANDKNKRGVGGFIGSNLSDSKMTNCLFTGTVDASAYNTTNSETNKNVSPRAGGFVGIIGNNSKMDISYSLSTGTIKVHQAATVGFGPIVGSSSMATLSNVYASDACKKVSVGTVKGEVVTYDQSKLNGYAGYQWTTLDFNKYWAVAIDPDKAPVLKSFAGKAPSVAGIVKFMDTSWYDAKKDVYVLNNLGELNGFALLSRETDFEGKTIKLGADIVANTGNAADWATTAPANSWLGIGADANVRFKGTFDGDGHTISGLYLKTTTAYQGMFGNTAENAVVKNFRLVNSYFESSARGIGSIAGRGKGTFETIYSEAIVVGQNASVGGLLGQDSPDGVRMNNCWFAGSVTNNQADSSQGHGTGGLIGNVLNPSVITNCLNTGTITADKYNRTPRVGGLIGAVNHKDAKISCCVNAGQIIDNGYEKGGYGAFAGHVVGTKMFDHCYAVKERCGTFAAGYSTLIDRTTSKLVAEKDAMGMASVVNLRSLFGDQDCWSVVSGGTPILKSFGAESGQKILSVKADTSWYDEKKDTYVLKDAEDLYGLTVLSRETNFEGKTIKLGADIVVNTGNAADWAAKAPELDWIKIGYNKSGDDNYRFNGTFDGQGYTISGIYLKTAESYTGLFGLTASEAVIRNFRLTNSYFESSARGVGSIAGSGKGTFETIYSDAIVVGNNGSVGGLLGQDAPNGVRMNNCWFAGSVTNNQADTDKGNGTGGLIGNVLNPSVITNCLNTGTITADKYNRTPRVGGLIGAVQHEEAKISYCVNAGQIVDNGYEKGGYGAFTGHIVGKNMFSNSYAVKEFCGTFAAGYSTQIDSATSKLVAQADAAGRNAIANMPALFCYQSEDGNYESYWVEKENEIPALKSFAEAEKSSVDVSWYDAEKTEYVLKDVADLYGFALLSQKTDFEGKTVKLGSDITVNEGNAADWANAAPVYDWPGIGADANVRFKGTFDGAGHTISGLYMKTTAAYQGMFGNTTGDAVVKNFRLVNSYFESSARGIGSIAGRGVGTFDTIYSDAIVVGNNASVGGLLGQDAPDGVHMNNCWFAGSVTNNQTDKDKGNGTGGLIGNLLNPSEVTNCLNTGTITARLYNKVPRVGGLIGAVSHKDAKISCCVNAGQIVGGAEEYPGGGYGAFTGHIVGENMFSNSYAVKEFCGTFAAGYTTLIDRTTSKLVAKADAIGLKGVANMPALFCYETEDGKYQSYWVTRTDDIPVLASFAETEASAVDVSWYDAEKTEYVLKDVADFYGFALLSQKTEFAGKTVKLGADMTVNEGKAADWGATAPAYSWPGIGADANVRFKGTFDGAGHTISGLYMKTTATYQGMFGNTTGDAVVKNFRLVNSYFESSARGIGSIAGRGVGTFDTIYSDAIVVGKGASVGGLLGQDAPDGVHMNNCWFAGSVTNNQTDSSQGHGTGGLIGNLQNPSVITNCLNTGTITADKYNRTPRVGGLVGAVLHADAKISCCVNAGQIVDNGYSNGGYGAFTGHIEKGCTNMFNNSYAVKEFCGTFAAGYTTLIDRTTSKLVAQADAAGENAIANMPALFGEENKSCWTTVPDGVPVLSSFQTAEALTEQQEAPKVSSTAALVSVRPFTVMQRLLASVAA